MIIIDHRTTVDMEDGQPLPPFYEHELDATWRIVSRFHDQKKTLWRRIRFSPSPTGARREIEQERH
jgi:hypothetical protein